MEDFDAAREAGIRIPEPEQPPRVIIATAHTSDYEPLAAITRNTVHDYCVKHGYDLYYEPQWEVTHPDLAKEADHMKVHIYKWLYNDNKLHNRYDVFMWIDTDAMVMNSEVTIDALLERCGVGENDHFLWGSDIKGPNSGVYFARFTWQAHAFMCTQLNSSIEMGWGDQAAMIQVALSHPYNQWVRCVDGKFFNAYPAHLYGWEDYKVNNYEDGDFIVHLPGLPQSVRMQVATEMAAKRT